MPFESDTREKIKTIIQGDQYNWEKDNLSAARNYLCGRFSTNKKIKRDFESESAIKEEQSAALITFINEQSLWRHDMATKDQFLTQGGEAEVFLANDHRHVIKLNEAVYYNTWLDFFNSVLIHNILFGYTAYTLAGFTKNDAGNLIAILQQPFIISESQADLEDVKQVLAFNGFVNTRRNDYYNRELGLVLEDIHDENVILNSNTFFFIDTVFYIHVEEDNK